MVDPSLNGDYPPKSLSNFADIISRCVQVSLFTFNLNWNFNLCATMQLISFLGRHVMQSEPEFRPAMSEVVLYLLNMIRKESQQNEK